MLYLGTIQIWLTMNRNLYVILLVLVVILSCKESESTDQKDLLVAEIEQVSAPVLNLTEANRLAQLPLDCIQTEYPNKLNQVIGSDDDLKSPETLHPAFYGCFDWHSAVHGHWSLVSLLKQFPDLENREQAMSMLLENITPEKIDTILDSLD